MSKLFESIMFLNDAKLNGRILTKIVFLALTIQNEAFDSVESFINYV